MVHYYKSFTSLFSLFLLTEDPVTLICSGEGFQYHCLSRDCSKPGSAEQISNHKPVHTYTRVAVKSVY